jgi:hypothetical protein
VDTSTHFCPNPDCAYRGWVGWGNRLLPVSTRDI